jgi:hypothetical protein
MYIKYCLENVKGTDHLGDPGHTWEQSYVQNRRQSVFMFSTHRKHSYSQCLRNGISCKMAWHQISWAVSQGD